VQTPESNVDLLATEFERVVLKIFSRISSLPPSIGKFARFFAADLQRHSLATALTPQLLIARWCLLRISLALPTGFSSLLA
jgi:hypothetical protein